MIHRHFIALVISFFASTAFAAPNWIEILGPSQGRIPAPLSDIVWRNDLQKALAESQQTNRPLFVTLRCLPCKQCSAFDKDVMEGGPLLAPLLSQFITVRLTDAKGIDFRLLPAETFQDFDISWWGYFLSPQGRIYAIFGGKDEVSDATRISPEALAATMKRVLAHHYDPRRENWNIDGAVPDLSGEVRSISSFPGIPAGINVAAPKKESKPASTATRSPRSSASPRSTPARSTKFATRKSGHSPKTSASSWIATTAYSSTRFNPPPPPPLLESKPAIPWPLPARAASSARPTSAASSIAARKAQAAFRSCGFTTERSCPAI